MARNVTATLPKVCPFCRDLFCQALGWAREFPPPGTGRRASSKAPQPSDLPARLKKLNQLYFAPAQKRWARLHARLAHGLAHHPEWMRTFGGHALELSDLVALARDALRQEAEKYPNPALAPLPLGQVVDLAFELAVCPEPCGKKQQPLARQFKISGLPNALFTWAQAQGLGWRSLGQRPCLKGRELTTLVLLKLEGRRGPFERGLVFTLRLELMAAGTGAVYPAAPLGFMLLDEDFTGAIHTALAAARTQGVVLPSHQDVRYSLSPLATPNHERIAEFLTRRLSAEEGGVDPADASIRWCGHDLNPAAKEDHELPVPKELGGDSMGLALAAGLVALLGPEQVPLDQVVFTGSVPEGEVVDLVDGVTLTGKLGRDVDYLGQRRLAHWLVYPHGDQGVPELWHRAGEGPLLAQAVHSLAEALAWLRQQVGPWAAVRKDQAQRYQNIRFLGGRTLKMERGYQQFPLARKLTAAELEQKRREAEERRRAEAERGGEDDGRTARLTDDAVSPYEPVSLPLAELCEPSVEHQATLGRILLGDPGGGKTTTGMHVVRLAATGQAGPAMTSRLPVFVRLREWGENDRAKPLEDYLADPGWDNLPPDWPRDPQFWKGLLDKGDVFLVLDGLDECPPTLLAKLPELVKAWAAKMPVLLTCREKNFAAHVDMFPELPVFRLQPFATEQRNAFIRASNLKAERQAALIAHLDHTPAVNELALRPFQLDALCLVAGEGTELPETRCALLAAAVNVLLDPKCVREAAPVRWPGEAPEVWQLRRLLARVAWTLNAPQPGRNSFTEEEFGLAVKAACEAEGLEPKQNWPRACRQFFTQQARLVVPGGRASCFAHNLLQEFLCAVRLHLAIQHPTVPTREDGWERPMEEDEPQTPWQFIRRKPYERGWPEVIPLLAGLLHNPEPFFRALAPIEWGEPGYQLLPNGHPPGKVDDLCRTRLTVAVRGLGEVKRGQPGQLGERLRTFAGNVIECYHAHRDNETSALLPNLKSALPALVRFDFKVKGQPWVEWFDQRLRDPEHSVRRGAAEELEKLGLAVAQYPVLLNRLFETLKGEHSEPEDGVYESLFTVLRKLVPAIAQHPGLLDLFVEVFGEYAPAERAWGQLGLVVAQHPGLLNRLVQLLHDPHVWVRRRAANMVGQLGPAVVQHPALLDGLVELLRDPGGGVRQSAAYVLGRLGPTVAQHPRLLDGLVQLLSDPGKHMHINEPDEEVRRSAAYALGQLGPAVAQHPALLDGLVQWLNDPNEEVRGSAAAHLEKLGLAVAQHPVVLNCLVHLLKDPHEWVRRRAAETLGTLGPAIAQHPGLLDGLVELLRSRKGDVRVEAARALRRLDPVVVQHPGLLDRLLQLLSDPEWLVRSVAARWLGNLGPVAAQHPGLLDGLIGLLSDPEELVRDAAADALGQLGPAAAQYPHPGLLDGLLQWLSDPHEWARPTAARALGKLGPAVARHPVLLNRLVQWLNDPHAWVRATAAGAVGELGPAVAQHPGLLEGLVQLLRETNSEAPRKAASSLGQLGPPAAQHPGLVDGLVQLLRDPDWNMRANALGALGHLGPAIVQHPVLLNRLVQLLGDSEAAVRRSAAYELMEVGQVVAQHPGLLDDLVQLLSGPGSWTRVCVARRIAAWNAQGTCVWLDAGGQAHAGPFPPD